MTVCAQGRIFRAMLFSADPAEESQPSGTNRGDAYQDKRDCNEKTPNNKEDGWLSTTRQWSLQLNKQNNNDGTQHDQPHHDQPYLGNTAIVSLHACSQFPIAYHNRREAG